MFFPPFFRFFYYSSPLIGFCFNCVVPFNLNFHVALMCVWVWVVSDVSIFQWIECIFFFLKNLRYLCQCKTELFQNEGTSVVCLLFIEIRWKRKEKLTKLIQRFCEQLEGRTRMNFVDIGKQLKSSFFSSEQTICEIEFEIVGLSTGLYVWPLIFNWNYNIFALFNLVWISLLANKYRSVN